MATPIEKLRQKCLERGVDGIKSIGRMFRMYDGNRDVVLDREELELGLQRYGLDMSAKDVDELFHYLDKDASGNVNFEELLISLRPPMSQVRLDTIEKAFKKMDKSGDGVITVKDLQGHYHVIQKGDKKEAIQQFLNTFQAGSDDDKVTKEEFINYYSGVSASVDCDQKFVEMLTSEWQL